MLTTLRRTNKMKLRILGLVILLTVGIGTTYGQWRYGLRLGGSGSAWLLKNGDDIRAHRGSGFSGGPTFEWQSPMTGFAVDLSALYTHSGGKLSHGPGKAVSPGVDFIEVPVGLKYKFFLKGIKELAGPYITTGPTLLVRLNGTSADCPVSTRRLQPAWNIGAGFDVLNFIQLQGQYRFGLGNSATTPDGLTLRADGWSVSVALLFDF